MLNSKYIRPFPYYGGKFSHLDFILPLLPSDSLHLCDVFGGSGAVVFNAKARSKTYNDIDSRLITFFRTLRDKPEELRRYIALTPFSRDEFYRIANLDDTKISDIESSAKTFLMFSQGFGAHYTSDRKPSWRSSPAGRTHRKWYKTDDDLDKIALQLKTMNIENLSWKDFINRYNHKDVVLYVDPPYVPESRVVSKSYEYELSYIDHCDLLTELQRTKSRVLLSGYLNTLYSERLSDWIMIKNKPRVKSSSNKTSATEVVWMNYGYGKQQPDIESEIKTFLENY